MTRALALALAALLAAGGAAAPPRTTVLARPDPEAAVARALQERIAAAGDTAPVAGTLSAALNRFYESRAWRPAWLRNRALELVGAIAAAPADGLRPADYPLDSIRALLDLPTPGPADLAALDLLLSGTFLLYAEHISSGRFTPWSADNMWSATAADLDFAAALTLATDSAPVTSVFRALAPPYAGYERLRAQLTGASEDVAQRIEANLERWRWLPRSLGARYIVVNTPAFTVELTDSGRSAFAARVIVGRPDWPTPITTTAVTQIVFNPAWYIPRTIGLAEVIPAQIRDSTYLSRAGIRVFPVRGQREVDPTTVDWRKVTERNYAYRLVQDPGPANPLGVVRLYAANPFGVALHDTPQRSLFAEPARAFSHGCVRVERALELAQQLLRDVPGWTPDTVAAVLRVGRERAAVLPDAVPVVFAYWTAWVDDDGVLQLRDDVYGWDARLANALAPPRAASASSMRTSSSSVCEKSP
jgi:murein L,D-transpeptidase YcbB/YkuD